MKEQAGEPRALGFPSLLALGVNGIVGVGIFFTPSKVAELVPGPAGVAVYALTALALLPVACVYATLGSRFDEDGGPYVWARAAFGPGFGFAVGWIAYASALFSTAAVVAGLSAHAAPALGLEGEHSRQVLALICILCLSAVAASGLRPSALVWSGITILKLLPLLALGALFLAAKPAWPAAVAAGPAFAAPELARAALLVVFSLQGFEIVAVPAGHARRSAWTVPAATLASLMLAAGLYVVLHAASVQALPDLAASGSPLVDAGRAYGGALAGRLLEIGTTVSALGIAFAMFAMTPRYLAALGQSDALGRAIRREDSRRVPQRALWISAALVLSLVLAGALGELFVLSSVAVLAQYAVSTAALLVLGLRRQHGLGLAQLWPAPLALGAIALIAHAATRRELVVAGAALVVGGMVLFLRRRLAR